MGLLPAGLLPHTRLVAGGTCAAAFAWKRSRAAAQQQTPQPKASRCTACLGACVYPLWHSCPTNTPTRMMLLLCWLYRVRAAQWRAQCWQQRSAATHLTGQGGQQQAAAQGTQPLLLHRQHRPQQRRGSSLPQPIGVCRESRQVRWRSVFCVVQWDGCGGGVAMGAVGGEVCLSGLRCCMVLHSCRRHGTQPLLLHRQHRPQQRRGSSLPQPTGVCRESRQVRWRSVFGVVE
jgi:hypothetical protein